MNKSELWKLILVVFIISWIGVIPSLLIAYEISLPNALKRLDLLMTFGPLIGALIFIYRAKGKQGIKDLFSRLLYFKTTGFVVAIALGVPILSTLIGSTLGLQLSATPWPAAYTPQNILLDALRITCMYLLLNTEEIVWRGIVFDELLKKYSFFNSCLILGPIWFLFHLPLFLYPGGHIAGYGIGIFTFIVFAQTIILGWIYINSNKSLLYVHLSHQLINGVGEAFPIFPVFISGNLLPMSIFTVFLVLVAFFLLWRQRKVSTRVK